MAIISYCDITGIQLESNILHWLTVLSVVEYIEIAISSTELFSFILILWLGFWGLFFIFNIIWYTFIALKYLFYIGKDFIPK